MSKPITQQEYLKMLRHKLVLNINTLQTSDRKSRKISLAVTKLEEAVLWLNSDLEDLEYDLTNARKIQEDPQASLFGSGDG